MMGYMMNTNTTPAAASYYDHALNHYPVQAHAIARAARTAKAAGDAYRVEFTTTAGAAKWWEGCRYDALALAKSLLRNGGTVTLTAPDGRAVDIAAARY